MVPDLSQPWEFLSGTQLKTLYLPIKKLELLKNNSNDICSTPDSDTAVLPPWYFFHLHYRPTRGLLGATSASSGPEGAPNWAETHSFYRYPPDYLKTPWDHVLLIYRWPSDYLQYTPGFIYHYYFLMPTASCSQGPSISDPSSHNDYHNVSFIKLPTSVFPSNIIIIIISSTHEIWF